MTVVTAEIIGDRKVVLEFQKFPTLAHDRLKERIVSLTERLEALVVANMPERTGQLRSTVISRVFDQPERIAGFVTVSADFAKTAALEYGWRPHRGPKLGSGHSAKRVRQSRFLAMLGPPASMVEALGGGKVAGRFFFRRAAEAIADEAIDEMHFAVDQAVKDAGG